MNIDRIVVGDLKNNCYIVSSDKNNAVIIDAGSEGQKIIDKIKNNRYNLKYILLTHGHYDHIGAVGIIKKAYPNAKICISDADKDCLIDGHKSLALQYGNYEQESVNYDIIIEDDQIITFDDIKIRCILTPGHTKGGVCYFINNILFTGDTIFNGAVGRTDFEGGSDKELKWSIQKIYKTIKPTKENPVKIYPGHIFSSTLYNQKQANQYVKKCT